VLRNWVKGQKKFWISSLCFGKTATLRTNALSSYTRMNPPAGHSNANTDHPLQHRTDEAIYQAYVESGDPALAEELYKRYLHLVLGVCYKYLKDREEARDACMQVFQQLLIKPQRTAIRSFRDWLFIITRNHCLMVLRKANTREKYLGARFHELQAEIMESAARIHLYDADEQERRLSLLRSALARLPDEQRKCIELFYYEDLSYRQISEQTGYGLKQVKSCLQNGKRNLKILMDHGKA